MPNKTIYVREEDVELFEKAEQLGGDNLSATVAEALRRFVATAEAKQKGFEEFTIKVGVWRPQGDSDTRKIKFIGRKLAEGTVYTGQLASRDDRGFGYRIYQTQTGKIVIRWVHWSRWDKESDDADYAVLESLPGYDQRVAGTLDPDWEITVPGDILQEAANELGQELAEWIE